jgi:dTDP-4-amino-4,6-dideoxygalactose transaminase
LPFIIKKRREIADVYSRELGSIQYIRLPKIPEYAFHNYQSYWIELRQSSPLSRDAFMQGLLDMDISTRRGIMAVHREACYQNKRLSLSETERITENSVLIPIYPSMTSEECEYLLSSLKEVLLRYA